MSFSISFHLTRGSRGHWGYDYYLYTCMNPDSAQFHNMASIMHFSMAGTDPNILWISCSALQAKIAESMSQFFLTKEAFCRSIK